ncbi:MAG: glycine zipper 2TM domain-containing protein [Xanthomonadaceae bacterium]|nr:glycine zipper 2TM domain-containing protein [Xanthomonadaceae bacterium]
MKSSLVLAAVLGLAATASALPAAAAGNVMVNRNGSIWVRCYDCGVVRSVETIQTQTADHKVAGTILGGVVGGLLGHQVGGGRGKTLATVAGAVGGGYAGNRLGQSHDNVTYVVNVRMAGGNLTRVQVKDAANIRQGDVVRVDGNGNVAVVGHQ